MSNGFCNISVKKTKYKSGNKKSLYNLWVHIMRKHKQDYQLADKEKQKDNDILIGDENTPYTKLLNDFLKVNDLKVRNRETVQAYQVVFSIPKSCFGNQKLIDEWKKSVVDFINTNEIFKGNCLSLVYHGDETQPHCQGVFVPRTEGKLNFKKLLGGVEGSLKFTKLQDDFATAMKPLGFDRGDGTHTNGLTQQEYLKSIGELSKPSPTPVALDPVPEVGLLNKGKVISALENNNSKLIKENKSLKKEIKKMTFYKTQFENAVKNNKELKKSVRNYRSEKMALSKEQTENLRQIDCNDVLEVLGFQPKIEGETTRTKTQDLNLVVNYDNKFFENQNNIGGGGAIDLLVKVFKYSFKESIEFLSSNFGFERTAKVITANKNHTQEIVKKATQTINLELPARKDLNLPKIVDYLTSKRKIDKSIVEKLISTKMLYADSKNNCVFTNDKNTFAFIRGTYDGKRFVGVKGELDFIKYDFNNHNNENLFVFESAIDALSYRTLNPDKDGVYLVVNGSALINRVFEVADNFKKTTLCFDNDEAGQKFCAKIQGSTISTVIVEKPLSKDFNEDLINGYSTTTSPRLGTGNPETSSRVAGKTEEVNPDSTVRNRKNRI